MAKPSKTPIIQKFVSTNFNQTFSTKEMCAAIGVSLPTLLAFIKINPENFQSINYGVYRIVQTTSVQTA